MILELDGLSHYYGTEPAVENVSFGLEEGELVALLGPSGCGKTTLVQAIAGHIRPTAGRVRLRGVDVTDEPPESRQVGVVFQQSTLFPHMTVEENVAYGLEPAELEGGQERERVAEYLELVDLADQQDAHPAALSGGQQRRAELARALAPEPDVLVLDEPLSALDRALRAQLREEIARIQRGTGVTTLFVTHDQEDAMALADRMVVMSDGQVAGVGPPRTLYQSPPTRFVAEFLGRSNTVPVTVSEVEPLTVRVGEQELVLAEATVEPPVGADIICHVRPEQLTLQPADDDGTSLSLSGEVAQVVDAGRRYDVTVRVPTGTEVVVEQTGNPPSVGDECSVELPQDGVRVFEGTNQ